jgi:hypothetical protein
METQLACWDSLVQLFFFSRPRRLPCRPPHLRPRSCLHRRPIGSTSMHLSRIRRLASRRIWRLPSTKSPNRITARRTFQNGLLLGRTVRDLRLGNRIAPRLGYRRTSGSSNTWKRGATNSNTRQPAQMAMSPPPAAQFGGTSTTSAPIRKTTASKMAPMAWSVD